MHSAWQALGKCWLLSLWPHWNTKVTEVSRIMRWFLEVGNRWMKINIGTATADCDICHMEKKKPLPGEWEKSSWQQSMKEKRQYRSSAQNMRKSGYKLPVVSNTVTTSHVWLLTSGNVASLTRCSVYNTHTKFWRF